MMKDRIENLGAEFHTGTSAAAVRESAMGFDHTIQIASVDARVHHHQPQRNNRAPTAGKSFNPNTVDHIGPEITRWGLVTRIICLAWLMSALLLLSTGLSYISIFTGARLYNARAQLQAQTNTVHREQLLYSHLDMILATHLDRVPLESHEDCLERGLLTAHYQLFGLGFEYEDIRRQTADWVQNNCGRLMYTPQVFRLSPEKTISKYWAQITSQSRQMIQKTYTRVRGRASFMWNHTFRTSRIEENIARWYRAANLANMVDITVYYLVQLPVDHLTRRDQREYESTPDIHEPITDPRERISMPFDFELLCEPLQPCRLVDLQTTTTPSNKTTSSEDAIAQLQRRVCKLSTFSDSLVTIRSSLRILILFLVIAQLPWLIDYFFEPCLHLFMHILSNIAAVEPEPLFGILSTYTPSTGAQLVLICSLVQVLLTILPWNVKSTDVPDNTALWFGAMWIVCSITMLTAFCSPSPDGRYSMAGSLLGDLQTLWKKCVASSTKIANEDRRTQTQYREQEQAVHHASSGSYMPPHRLVSPSSTLQEDIQAELRALREARQSAYLGDYDSEMYTESETDTESEDEVWSDAESGWSLVGA